MPGACGFIGASRVERGEDGDRYAQPHGSRTDRRLTVESGLLTRDLHQTRLHRVQNVNLRQTVLERMLSVGDVDFDTASSADYDFSFRGVAAPRDIVQTVDRALHDLHEGRGSETEAAEL